MNHVNNEQIWIIADSNDNETVSALEGIFEDYDTVKEDHCTGCGFLAIVVSAVAFFAKSENAKTVLEGLFEKEKIEIEYEGIKIKGSFSHVHTVLEELLEDKNRDREQDKEHSSSQNNSSEKSADE